MMKLLLVYLLASLTGHPLLAMVVLLGALYALDRGTFRVVPNVFPAFKRYAEQRRLEQDVRVNPHDADARASLGRVLLERGHAAQAAEQLKKALAKVDVAETHFYLGLALLRGPNWTEAREHLEKAAQLDPGYRMGEAQLRLGEYWTRSGDHERARSAYESFLSRHESSVEGQLLAARGRQAAGDPEGARVHLEAALASHASAPRFRRRLDRLWAWRARSMLRGLPARKPVRKSA